MHLVQVLPLMSERREGSEGCGAEASKATMFLALTKADSYPLHQKALSKKKKISRLKVSLPILVTEK